MIRTMLSYVRILLAITLFIHSWALTIGSILYLFQKASLLLFPQIIPVWNKGIIVLSSISPDASNQILSKLLFHSNNPLFYPSDSIFSHIYLISITMGSIVLSFHILMILIRPIEKEVLDAAQGKQVNRIARNNDVSLLIGEMAKKAGIAKPLLYEIQSYEVNAFAIGKPFRNAISITSGALNLPTAHLLWIVGHEIGHLKAGDSTPTMLWIAAHRSAVWFYMIRVRIILFMNPVLIRIPIVRLFVFPVEILLVIAFRITAFADYIARKIFTIIDRFLLRSVEYKADAFAANLVGAQYGMDVMSILGEANQRPRLMDSHPPSFKRKRRMQKLLRKT